MVLARGTGWLVEDFVRAHGLEYCHRVAELEDAVRSNPEVFLINQGQWLRLEFNYVNEWLEKHLAQLL